MRRVLVATELAAHEPQPGAVLHALHGRTMGTTWSVRLAGTRTCDLGAVQLRVQQRLDGLVRQMSHWEPGSVLSRFNAAPAGSWHVVPEDFFTVLQAGLRVAADSAGAYDPAAGALVQAWGFGARGRFDEPGFRPPAAAQRDAARACGGWQALQVDGPARALRQPGGLQLDFSAIAKGYAVDCVAHLLDEQGFAAHLVEVGGELRGTGVKPDGQPWWVALEAPPVDVAGSDPPPLPQTMVALHGLAVATSGDYRRCFMHGPHRISHTLDPRSGLPLAHGLAAVSVLHPSCMLADALSTAVTVLGPQQGLAWAARQGLAARLVTRHADGRHEEALTPACAAMAA